MRHASGRRVVSTFTATAFAQDDVEAAQGQWRKVADQLRPKLPRLAGVLDGAKIDVVAYTTFPPQHRTELTSTNPIERLKGKIKRRPPLLSTPVKKLSRSVNTRELRNQITTTAQPPVRQHNHSITSEALQLICRES